MKKITYLLCASIAAFSFYACNDSKEKKTASEENSSPTTSNVSVDSTGITNLLLPNDSAMIMMARFDSIYKKIKTGSPITYLKNSQWIDAMLISSYANFFETNAGKAYDGVRFVNAATNNRTDSRLLMVLTKPGGKYHTDVWRKGLITLESGDPTEYLDWETDSSVAARIKNNFDSLYRRGRGLPRDKDPLSESVWMSRAVFIYLRNEIKKPENQIDGIRIYMGAYGKMMGIPGQIHPNQSTILLVPTTSGGPKIHNDRWDLLRPEKPLQIFDVLNHGELCPNRCD